MSSLTGSKLSDTMFNLLSIAAAPGGRVEIGANCWASNSVNDAKKFNKLTVDGAIERGFLQVQKNRRGDRSGAVNYSITEAGIQAVKARGSK